MDQAMQEQKHAKNMSLYVLCRIMEVVWFGSLVGTIGE